jgi:hypothetical protein
LSDAPSERRRPVGFIAGGALELLLADAATAVEVDAVPGDALEAAVVSALQGHCACGGKMQLDAAPTTRTSPARSATSCFMIEALTSWFVCALYRAVHESPDQIAVNYTHIPCSPPRRGATVDDMPRSMTSIDRLDASDRGATRPLHDALRRAICPVDLRAWKA